jgi:hypothetical protein
VLREEGLESWDSIVSDEVVYLAQSINSNLEIRDRVSSFDWLSEYDCGNIYIKLGLVFLGQRDTHYRCVIEIAPPDRRNIEDRKLKIDASDADKLVLVHIAESIQLPEGVILKRRPSLVRLKRIDNPLHSIREFHIARKISNTFPISGIGFRRVFDNGESSPIIRGLGSKQGKLPSELIETGSEIVSKLPNEHPDGVGSNFLLHAKEVPRVLSVILSREDVCIIPKFFDLPLQFVEALIPPTKFHLCVGQSDAHDPLILPRDIKG